MAEVKDYVKNIENKSKLQSSVDRDKIPDDFVFQKFDKEMEDHFDLFVKTHKDEFSEKTSKASLQVLFNKWLDDELIKMDDFKDKEIEKSIIGPTTFELQRFETAVDLGIFQKELNERKDETKREEIVSVNGNELKIQTYKDISGEKIDKGEIAELFSKNFEKRDDLLNLLKLGGVDNVKKFQRIIIGVTEDDTSKDDDKTTLLGTYGVDGRFGGNTMKAFKDYISRKEIHTNSQNDIAGDQVETLVDNPQGAVTDAPEIVDNNVVIDDGGNHRGVPEVTGDVVDLNKTSLTLDEAKKIIEQEKDKNVLKLPNLESITAEVAAELANFEGKDGIELTGLKNVDKDVFKALLKGKCVYVKFKNGELIKDKRNLPQNKLSNGVPCCRSGNTRLNIDMNTIESTLSRMDDIFATIVEGASVVSNPTEGGGVVPEGVVNIVNDNDNGNDNGNDNDNGNGNDNGNDNNTRADVQQQYEGVGYNVDNHEATREAATDEEAIQYLTKGSGKGVFFIARWFGKKKHNAELSIVDAKYEPLGQEKTDLNNLNKYLLECKDSPTDVFTKIFKKQKDFGDNENLGKLYDLYRECKNDQNGTKKGAYLKKVMGLLENYFVRGGKKDKNGKDITTFKDMYNNELLGVKKDLEKKEKKAKNSLEDGEKEQLQESGGTALEAVNTKTNMEKPYESFKEFKDKYGFDTEAETQFAMCLCDLNADGRIDSRDMNAKTGQELFNMIKDAKVDQNYNVLEHSPMYNILSFATIKAEQDGHANTAEFLKGVDLTKSDEEIMNKLKKRPLTIQYLRYMLINSPMDMANNIIRYGGVKVETNKDDETGLNLDKETQEAINKIMSHEKFEEIYGNAYSQLVSQGLNDTPEIKKKLRPIIALALLESSGNYGGGLSGGIDLNLGKAGDIAFLLGVGYGPDGNIMAGVNVAYGKSRALGKRKGSIISVGVGGGINYSEGQFVPMVIGSAGFSQMINGPILEKKLEERSSKFLGVDGNIGAFFAGPITVPVWGVGLSYSQDKMKGLNITYESIKSDLGNVLKDSLKDKRPNTTDKTEMRTQMIDSIKAALESRFGRSREKTLDQAAQNIFGGISYYLTEIENPSQITEEQKTAVIEKVAENYANQWRNKAMQNLDGKTTFENVRVGVEFLGGFWPIPMASVSFKTYGNLTADETVESMQNYYKRLSSGSGMAYIESSVDNEGYINTGILKYLNDKLSVLSPSGNVPKIQRVPGVGDKSDLSIPIDLCKYVNICYSPELEGFIDYEASGDRSFRVPANIRVGLLTYSRSSEGKYNLILGDYKKGSDFVDLDINSTPEGDTSEYKGKEGEFRIDESTINDNEKMQELFKMSDFPLSECVDSKDGKVFFKLKDGFNIDTSGNPKIEIKQGILSALELGMLQITKTEQDKYKATFDDSVTGKLSIKYIDEKKARNSKQDIDLKDSFELSYEYLNSMFHGIEERLSRLDDGQWGNYASFMDAASNAGSDKVLDTDDYDSAFDCLKTMLTYLRPNDLKISKLSDLKQYIESGNPSPEEKVLIVDRFKMLFSYHIDLTDGQKDGQKDGEKLASTVSTRGNAYEKRLKGYNGELIPESLHGFRDRIVNKLKNSPELDRQPRPGLIGMTAFYRYREGGQRITTGRGYSMTEMGRTTVLGGAYEDITDDEASRNRFISNLEKSDVHKKILNESLTNKIRSVKGLKNVTISNEQLIQLLEGKDIDIGTKNIKIGIEAKYMFYLLGECGNESIGVNLENLIIKGAGDGGDGDDGIFEVDINPGVSYENASGISIDGVAAENRLNIGREQSRTYGVSAVSNNNPEPKPNPGSDPNGGIEPDPNQGSDPNGGIEPDPNPGSIPVTPIPKDMPSATSVVEK